MEYGDKLKKNLIMQNLISLLFKTRAVVNRVLIPSKSYYIFDGKIRTTSPISQKFGFDRGTPIDRYWIESFLTKNKKSIRGRVLEVTDPNYTIKFGSTQVVTSDVIDINPKNKHATIHADLRNLKRKIKDNTYDCIILTHVLGLIDDYESVLKECRRILKYDGTLLFTGSCLGPILPNNEVYWRFTEKSVDYIFKKYFGAKKLTIESYGNALSGQAFWVGMAQEDLSKKELMIKDNRFPCIVSAVVTK